MIRTAILAGILLVMIAIAADRNVSVPNLPRLALVPAEQTTQPAEQFAQPIVREVTPAPVREEIAAPAPLPLRVEEKHEAPVATVSAPEIAAPVAPPIEPTIEPLKEPVRAAGPAMLLGAGEGDTRAADVAAIAPAVPALPPTTNGAPTRLLPPTFDPAPVAAQPEPPGPVAAVPATPQAVAALPTVDVPRRPLYRPVNELPRGQAAAQMPELAPETVIVQAAEAPTKFMTPEERSRELYRLAREMEDTFMSKLAR